MNYLPLAEQCNLIEEHPVNHSSVEYLADLQRFAELVAAQEREECAKVCEAQQNMAVMRHPARIEVEQSTQNMMALKCAGLIRARGQS